MNIASTEELSDRDVIIAFKVTITTRKDQSFKQSRQKDWDSLGSRQQKENKHKKQVQQMKEWREGSQTHQST